jgi:ABC-2 type transport system ATP-binding protein
MAEEQRRSKLLIKNGPTLTTRLDGSTDSSSLTPPPEAGNPQAASEERIPEGGLEGVRRRAQEEARLREERIPVGGLASLHAAHDHPIVRTSGLTKAYLGTTALADVNLTLFAGEIFGLVGPNGAGKTTLLKILATLIQPDAGEAVICGYPLHKVREIRARIGFMPDVLGVYDDMLVREYLEFFARANLIPAATRDFVVDETLKVVGISHMAQQPVDGLSRGLKQRLCLGRSILHKPKLLLLDEPASGLDPLARLELREILRTLQRQGTTVVISSHVLEDLADMCDRIGVVKAGRLMCVEQTQKLIEEEGGRRLRLKAVGRSDELFEFLNRYPGVQGASWDNESIVFTMARSSEVQLAQLLKDTVDAGIPLVSFAEERQTLETAYLNVTRQAL